MAKLTSPTGKDITIDSIRDSAAVRSKYQYQLNALVSDMTSSYIYWLRAAWRKEGLIAQDRSHTEILKDILKKLGRKWQSKFDKAAEDIAKMFAEGSAKHNQAAMMGALKKAGFAIDFKMTNAMREAMKATTAGNVALIKSISSEYHGQIEKDVWRTVSAGGDLGDLTEVLKTRYGMTQKRAALIARDQTSKVRATLEQVRRTELGITEADWFHSHAGKSPRPSHVAAHGKRFDIRKGMYLDGKWVLPGEEINCRCTSRAVIKGFNS
jgi:uncharacterized protein with gpF-like domain